MPAESTSKIVGQPSRFEGTSGAVSSLELRLKEINQLYNSIDPSPFVTRDLDRDAAEYITKWADTTPSSTKLLLCVHLSAQPPPEKEAALEDSVQHHFSASLDILSRRIRLHFRYARMNLLIGLLFCAACMVVAELCNSISNPTMRDVLNQGLIVVAWVSLWRPVEMFLYDSKPLFAERSVLRRLSVMRVAVDYPEPGGSH